MSCCVVLIRGVVLYAVVCYDMVRRRVLCRVVVYWCVRWCDVVVSWCVVWWCIVVCCVVLCYDVVVM